MMCGPMEGVSQISANKQCKIDLKQMAKIRAQIARDGKIDMNYANELKRKSKRLVLQLLLAVFVFLGLILLLGRSVVVSSMSTRTEYAPPLGIVQNNRNLRGRAPNQQQTFWP